MQVIRSTLHQFLASPPLLTIAIPTWNRSAELQAQLQALANARIPQLEIVVCDNGSDDDSWIVLENEIANNRLALKCLRNNVNLGCDVNYLRALESASGEWTWLVGDDDKLNFSAIYSEILGILPRAESDLVFLSNYDDMSSVDGLIHRIDCHTFLHKNLDRSGVLFLKISRIVCRTVPARLHLPFAYAHGMGSLHSYSFVYGELIRNSGLETAYARRLFLSDPYSDHRWNPLYAHVGAWKTSLFVFRDYPRLARARERRVRASALYLSALYAIYRSEPLSPWLHFILRELPFAFGVRLFLVYLRFRRHRIGAVFRGRYRRSSPDLFY